MLEMISAFQEKIKDILRVGIDVPGSLPDGFTDKQQSLLMLDVLADVWPRKEIIGSLGRRGLRFKMGPIYMEIYVCSEEPVIEDFDHFRMICWQPLTRTEKPAGWHEDWLYLPSQYGVVELRDKKYWDVWADHAKRHRQKWLRDGRFEIVEDGLENFSVAYNKTHKVDRFLRASFLRTLRLHLEHHCRDVHLFVARRKEDKVIIGGLAVIDFPDIAESTHAISFISQEGLKTSVGTGLIDHWYKESIGRELRFLSFGLVWKKGDPNSWRGYSKFKNQFAPILMPYRYQFVKFVRGKKVDKK